MNRLADDGSSFDCRGWMDVSATLNQDASLSAVNDGLSNESQQNGNTTATPYLTLTRARVDRRPSAAVKARRADGLCGRHGADAAIVAGAALAGAGRRARARRAVKTGRTNVGGRLLAADWAVRAGRAADANEKLSTAGKGGARGRESQKLVINPVFKTNKPSSKQKSPGNKTTRPGQPYAHKHAHTKRARHTKQTHTSCR
jgi:hypothetical protein